MFCHQFFASIPSYVLLFFIHQTANPTCSKKVIKNKIEKNKKKYSKEKNHIHTERERERETEEGEAGGGGSESALSLCIITFNTIRV